MVKSFDEFSSTLNEGFWDWLTGKSEKGEEKAKGSDLGSLDRTVEGYYETLEDFADSGKSIQVQTLGNMKYSKLVEDIQIALEFLGYPLKRFGVDGFFGPETANSIIKFNQDTESKQPTNETIKTFAAFLSIHEAANGMLQKSDLVQIAGAGTSTNGKLNANAAKDYERMAAAAEADGIRWTISSSYRDYDSQVKTAANKGLYSQGGLAATPGMSNHGWGSAVDLDLSSEAQEWLQRNAADYGFSTIAREPWHWEHKASVEFAKSGAAGDSPSSVLIDADLIKRLIAALKEKDFKQEDLAKFAKNQAVALTSDSDEDFYKAVLVSLGAKPTPEKIKFLKAWRQAEGGKATNNPFNTTKNLPGDSDTNYNSVGVKNYPDKQSGLDATVATLKLDYYKDLVSKLMDDAVTADEIAASPDLKTWGTGDGVTRVLAGGSVNPPPIVA